MSEIVDTLYGKRVVLYDATGNAYFSGFQALSYEEQEEIRRRVYERTWSLHEHLHPESSVTRQAYVPQERPASTLAPQPVHSVEVPDKPYLHQYNNSSPVPRQGSLLEGLNRFN